MDVSAYLSMFLAECREHLQELNLALVKIEEQPDDRETVDSIFRIAHSLKGMSGTMGYVRMVELTHAMEDVFELLRQRERALPREAIDILLECLDTLSAAVDAIETEGEEQLEPGPLVERLHGLVYRRTAEQEAALRGAPPPPDDLFERAGARCVLHARVELDASVAMPAVRAYMVLSASAEHGEVIASIPPENGVEIFDGRTIEVWLASDHEADAYARTLAAVGDIASAEVVELSPEPWAAAAGPVADAAPDDAPAAVGPAEAGPELEEAAPPPVAKPVVKPVAKPTAAEGTAASHGKKAVATVRVDAERLDQLMHLMGEVVVARTRVETLAGGLEVPGLPQALKDLVRSSQSLQAMVMQVRMVPVEAVFLRMPRLVRDLSSKLGKQVELVLTGAETELDRTVVDTLGDPLVHLVRNALDHGIESPDARVKAGKPPTATLEISAKHAGGSVVIGVRDDGNGIDPQSVGRKAVANGLIPAEAVETLDMAGAIELLFSPGFSTASEMSEVSGRGVGMDAVRTAVRGLGGEITLSSELGVGTIAHIRLPLTLAILAALLVETGGRSLAIPLDRVERTLHLADHAVRHVAGQPMLLLRDGVLRLLDLATALGYESTGKGEHVVVVPAGDTRLALRVDRLIGQRELVTRPLPRTATAAALSGGAVLSDGGIALIVDCDRLAEKAGARILSTAA